MEKFPYKGNLEWLRSGLIFLTNHGSHAYGLNIPTSDIDIKGIAIPPRQYFYGFSNIFEQAESKDPDMVVYDIRKFFRLAADCNPNIIEVLWVDESNWRIITPLGQKIVEARELFLSRKAKHTFCGYAVSQLKRIKTHRRWLVNPPKEPPNRADFGLPKKTVIQADQLDAAFAAVQKKLDTWNIGDISGVDPATRIEIQRTIAELLAESKISVEDTYMAAARTIGYDENFIRLLDLERQYKARSTEWDHYQNWKITRNPARAELEAKFGFDSKHAMHLVRLLRMAREILTTGKVLVKRPDREELLGIRNGTWNYEELIEWAERQDNELQEIAKTSPLPHTPNRAKLDELCISIIEESFSQ